MTDPLEEALAAATRGLQALDQQYAAARDANGRLTAQVVQLEIQLRAKTADYNTLLEQYLLQGERFDNTREALDSASDALVAAQHLIAELRADAVMLRTAIDDLEGQIVRYRQ